MGWNNLKLVLGLTVFLASEGLQADPLSQWTWRYPNPQGLTLNAVTHGGGQFVAVGDNGTIITSPDGFNWTVQTYDVFPYLRGVAYADGEYAAVGDGGVILVSSNAEAWTQISSVTTNALHGIAGDTTWRSDGLPEFLAVGDSGTAVVCLGGTNWSVISSGTSSAFYGVSLDPSFSLFIVVGDAGTVAFFSTSLFYQVPQNSVGTTNNLYTVACASNGVVAAVGDLNYQAIVSAYPGAGYNVYYTNGILYSLDSGFIWTNQLWGGLYGLPNVWFPSSTFILHGVASGPDGFVAVGDTGYTL